MTIGGFAPRAIGVPWVRKEDWAAFVAIMKDGDDSPISWEVFNQRSEDFERQRTAEGHTVVRAYIDPETFPGGAPNMAIRSIPKAAQHSPRTLRLRSTVATTVELGDTTKPRAIVWARWSGPAIRQWRGCSPARHL